MPPTRSRTPPRWSCLGNALWRARIIADPGVVGGIINVDATRTEAVELMPPGFAFPGPETALWQPLHVDRETTQVDDFFYQGGWPPRRRH